MNAKLAKAVRGMLSNSRFRRLVFPTYGYEFTPAQLCFLCQCLQDTKHLHGAVAEVGCNDGATTLFLNRYLDCESIEKPYFAVDTFAGFVPADVEFEVEKRRKSKDMYEGRFEANSKKWFDRTMRLHGVSRVRSIQADVNAFDLRTLGPISFVLLDVDLYKPIRKALVELYEALEPGGTIVVDDCDAGNARWDGADQAYKEFMRAAGNEPIIVHRKLGVVRKAVSARL